MSRLLLPLLALAASAAGQAYTFSDGYLEVLGAEPAESFSCDGRPYGYYADVASECRVFHVCVPVVDPETEEVGETVQYSFFCGNQTVFSQDSLTCAHPESAYPCAEAEGYYDIVNAEFGKIPEGNE